MTCFTLHNREHEPIDNAEFILNGNPVRPGPGGQYCIDSLPAPPYHIIIHHPEYLDAEYNDLQQLSGQLYLLREGEDYYYQSFFKVPCLRTRDLLMVSLRRADSSGHQIQPGDAGRAFDSLLDRMNMRVMVDYGELLKDQPRPKGVDTRAQWNYIYLIGHNDRREFGETSTDLADLRRSDVIAFAGPALVRDKSMMGPFSYRPQLNVWFRPGIDAGKAKEFLLSMGFDRVVVNEMTGIMTYTIMLPPETGSGMNQVIERLHEHIDIINAQPEMWLPK